MKILWVIDAEWLTKKNEIEHENWTWMKEYLPSCRDTFHPQLTREVLKLFRIPFVLVFHCF